MPVAVSRAVALRQSQQALTRRTTTTTTVRHASSASEAASKAQQTASSAAAKATEGLTRVSASAGPALTNAAQGLGSTLKNVGGRTGKVISFVETMIPPTMYYSKVGLELGKLVFRGQNMTPPNMATFQSYYQHLLTAARNPPSGLFSSQNILSRVRNATPKELAFVGVTAAEVVGFFTVGEIVGRLHIVGYRGQPAHEHH